MSVKYWEGLRQLVSEIEEKSKRLDHIEPLGNGGVRFNYDGKDYPENLKKRMKWQMKNLLEGSDND